MAAKPALQVNIHDAKTNLSKYLARVEAGETLVIAKAGRPIAKLGPVDEPPVGEPPVKRKSILGALAHLGPIDDEAFRAMDKEIEDAIMDAVEKRW